MPNYTITDSTKEESELVWNGILEYEKERGGLEHDNQRGLTKGIEVKINKTIKDENDNILGGIISVIHYHWNTLYIELLWIHKDYRRRGYGSILLKEVERIAKEEECTLIHVETGESAKDFYIKNGYKTFGELDNVPYGDTRYYLKKMTK